MIVGIVSFFRIISIYIYIFSYVISVNIRMINEYELKVYVFQ